MPLRRKGLAVVMLPIAGVVLAAGAFFLAGRDHALARASVQRNQAVGDQLRRVLTLAVDTETAVRGFILTREERFLAPYSAARAALPHALDNLSALVDPEDEGQVAALRSLVDRRLELSDRMRTRSLPVGSVDPGTIELLDEGRATSESIRAQVKSMETTQLRALSEANARADLATRLGLAAVAGGLMLGIVGGLGGSALFTRGVTRRIRQLLRCADHLAAGHAIGETPSERDELGELGLAVARASQLLRQREQALDEARGFLARLLDSGPTVVLRVGIPSLECIYASPNIARIFDIPLTGSDEDVLRERLYPEDRQRVIAAAEQMATSGQQVQLDIRLRTGRRPRQWVSLLLLPDVNGNNHSGTALVYLVDIDERYRAQQQLRRREAALQAVLDASPDMISIVTAEGTVSLVNSAVETVLGRQPADIVGQSPFDFIHSDDRSQASVAFEQLVSGATRQAVVRYRAPHADGRLLVLESHASVLTRTGDDPAGVVVVTRDISERARAEELQEAAREAAERANRAKSEFVSRMSHELRTPLNAVLGFAQLLELDDLSAEQQEAVYHILRGGRHLLGLIDEILDMSRLESGRLKISPEPVLVAQAFTDVVELVRPLTIAANVQLAEPKAAEELYVLADRQRLVQILLNLVSNAVKYNRSGGSVWLTCERDRPGFLRLDVTDTGSGIPAEHLPLLFSPFERLGAEATNVEGTGIGLALSRQLAEALGGSLEVKTAVGRGSTFSLFLPEAEGPVERYDRLNGDIVETSSPRRGGTVLHVEDNASNLRLVERIFARHGNMRVVAAMQGRLGIELARQHRPRIVLLDLHLPDMSGDEVLRALRDDPETSNIPVIIASADATPGQVTRLMAAGAAGYVTKPIDVRRLLRLLDDVLGEDIEGS